MIETHNDITLWKNKFFTKGYDLMLNIQNGELVIEGYKTGENNMEFQARDIDELDISYQRIHHDEEIEKYVADINILTSGWHSCDGLLRVPMFEMYATTFHLSRRYELLLENGELYLIRDNDEDDRFEISGNGNFIYGFNSYYDRVTEEKSHIINLHSFDNERVKEMHTKMNEIFRLLGVK